MSHGTAFQVGSFDLTKYGEEERWARMNQLARVYAALSLDFRLLAFSRPYPLTAPLERIKEMMVVAQSPRLRQQISAYRRFLEQIIQQAYLKDTDYYLLTFENRNRSAHVLANTLAHGLRLPVRPVSRLPAPFPGEYDEAFNYLFPKRAQFPRGNQPHSNRPLLTILYSYDLRGQLTFDTLIDFLKLACSLSLAVDVKTIPPDKAVGMIKRAHNKLKADLLGQTANEAPDAEKQEGFLDTQRALQIIQHQRHALHQVVIAIAIEGRNREELEAHVALVQSTAANNQIYLRRANGHHIPALQFFSVKALPDLFDQFRRNMTSLGPAALTFYGYEVPKNTAGPFIAINRGSNAPLWLDKFSLPAYNEVVLGRTGSGKTFMAGLRAYRLRPHGVQTVIVDPQSNFRKVTEAAEGRYNLLRLGEGTALNILDVVHDNAAAQISHVIVLLEALLNRPLDNLEKGSLDRALYDLYGQFEVRTDCFEPETMPRLEDLHRLLTDPKNRYLPAPRLADDLDRFVHGSLRGIFNAHTTLSLDLDRRYPIITFDISDLEGEFQPIFIFALLSSIERVIRQRRSQQLPTNIVVDEFGILSQIPVLAQATGLLAKRVRAWKVGIQCMDQNWDTFDTTAGRRILENSLVKTIMRVDETAAPAIVENLGLTAYHAEVILSAGVGEGIMIVGSKPYHVFFQASRDELEMLCDPWSAGGKQRLESSLVALPTRR
jgi:hypothetical protein